MLDALMAVMIAALGAGIILSCVQVSRKSSALGLERRQALAHLQFLIETAPRKPFTHEAQLHGFGSLVTVTPVTEGGARFCKISARLISTRSKRTYNLSGLRWCASDVGEAS